MGRQFRNANRAKIDKPLPQWFNIPRKSGYYWYVDNMYGETPPTICSVEVHSEDDGGAIWVWLEGGDVDGPLEDFEQNSPKFSGPLDVPINPMLTEGLSNHSAVGSNWAYDADRLVIRHLRSKCEIDLETDNYSGWILWLRNEDWFAPYMEEELERFCKKYAPKNWMK